MSTSPVLDHVPTLEHADPLDRPAQPSRQSGALTFLLSGTWYLICFFFGWLWRVTMMGLLGANFGTSILIVGFLNRWTQGRVLYGLWKASGRRDEGSFTEFCAKLGPDAPVLRPRLFIREWFRKDHVQQELTQRTLDNEVPGPLVQACRALLVPFRSLWLNAKLGFLGVFCTFVLTAWGCLLMQLGWEFGWLNSFNKGYEQAGIGAALSVTGIALFIAAMGYVPMAQIHFAVTGDYRSFFDFRFVSQLIRARYLSYVLLAVGVVLFSVVIQVLRVAPAFFGNAEAWSSPALSDAAILHALQGYYFWCNVTLFLGLLATHGFAAWIYRSALVKVLRRGRVTPEQLHPLLRQWFDALGGLPAAEPEREGAWLHAARGLRWLVRVACGVALYGAIWLAFVVFLYISEFFNYHPYIGFLNQQQIQLPAFDYLPSSLTHQAGWDSMPNRLTPKEEP
jgi:hypothetical protein